jgi:hypothetical protein
MANYADVGLLLPLFGANNGIIFDDYSAVPKQIGRAGDTKTVTDQSKYYGSSAYFDGNGDSLTLGAIHFGSGNFTAEAWIRLGDNTGDRSIFSQFSAASSVRTIFDIRSGKLSIFNGAQGSFSGPTTIAADTWVHVAFCRNGTTCNGFLNGVLEVTHTNFLTPFAATTRLGAYDGASTGFFIGHMQDVRITSGVLYAGSFTPPDRMIGQISGVITDDNGDPAIRTAYAVPRSAPLRVFGPVQSASDGTYLINAPATECSRIVLDNATTDPLYNDLIDRVIPQ